MGIGDPTLPAEGKIGCADPLSLMGTSPKHGLERRTVALVVQKYGGSSVSDADRIRRVAERIVETKKAGNDVVVVVSAMGDTTDELLDLARQVCPAPPPREMDMLLTSGERISNALVAMAIHSLGAAGPVVHRLAGGRHHHRHARQRQDHRRHARAGCATRSTRA